MTPKEILDYYEAIVKQHKNSTSIQWGAAIDYARANVPTVTWRIIVNDIRSAVSYSHIHAHLSRDENGCVEKCLCLTGKVEEKKRFWSEPEGFNVRANLDLDQHDFAFSLRRGDVVVLTGKPDVHIDNYKRILLHEGS